MQDLFVFEQTGFNEKGRVIGKHVPTGITPYCMEKLQAYGEKLPVDLFEARDFEMTFRRR